MTFQKMCALKKPLVKNVIHDIPKNVCFEKTISKNVIHDIPKNVCF